MYRWVVLQKDSGQSLQLFLKHQLDGISGKQIKRLVDSGKCLLNGKAERFASKLVGTGDKIELIDIPPANKEVGAKSHEASILFSDNDFIAYNKPPGISSDSSGITESLQKHFKFKDLILLHRLDKDTTGVLLFARHEDAAVAMLNLFKKRLIKKTYLAIVHGVPSQSGGIVENYLGKLHTYHGQTIWGAVSEEKGLWSKTSWKVKKTGKEASLVVCHPLTGRTHQIRVHLSGLGYPILGDHQYGDVGMESFSSPRVLLHASEVSFEHPRTRQNIHILSPLPEDFSNAIKILMGQA